MKPGKLATWGRAMRITFGAVAILGVLASNAATAAQISNPSETTQAALDNLLNRYDQVIEQRLNGGSILAGLPLYDNLSTALDEYLQAIEASIQTRYAIRQGMLGWFTD